jgi:hypothetical protein
MPLAGMEIRGAGADQIPEREALWVIMLFLIPI